MLNKLFELKKGYNREDAKKYATRLRHDGHRIFINTVKDVNNNTVGYFVVVD